MMTKKHHGRPKIVVLGGPTGVGKTRLSLALAAAFGAHIINADSMQIYRYMDIGTAKPTPEEQAAAPHHLIDIVDPDQEFNAADYLRAARPLIDGLHAEQVPSVVVGGTGLYLRSLLKGLFEGPGQDPALRERLKEEARVKGREALHARLASLDPDSAARLHPHDLVRIVRALEVLEVTGRPISAFQTEHALAERPYEVLFYCLNLPRQELYERIELRTAVMLEQGLIEETAALLERGYSPDLKPLQAIGYKEAVAQLQGRLTRQEAAAEIAKQTRRFAKRQLTWFRGQPEAVWRSPADVDVVLREAEEFWKE